MIRTYRHDRLNDKNRTSRLSANLWKSTGLMRAIWVRGEQNIRDFERMLKFVYRVLGVRGKQASQPRQRIDGLSDCSPRHPSGIPAENFAALFAREWEG